MTDPNASNESERIWRANLDALRSVDADLADRLGAVPLPQHATPATGRDGSPTYRLQTPEGPRWLGHTSMPTVSGPAILSNFDPGAGNVALAGIGQGIEARLLTQHLGPNQAVFVLERDAEAVSLALRVHELTDPLRNGRLVLIVDADPGRALLAFLEGHEGYLAPERMVNWPWLASPAVNEARLILQRAASRIGRHRASALAECVAALRTAHVERQVLPDGPRTLVVYPRADREICRFARQALTGLAELDWPAEGWLGDTPRTAHSLAMARRIAEFRPDMVLLIDTVRSGLAHLLPATIPVASWIMSGTRLTPTAIGGIGPDDRVFAATERVVADARDAGPPSERVQWLAPAVIVGDGGDPEPDRPRTHDVVAVVDARSLSPGANGLSLESHRTLWKRVHRLIDEQVERYTDGQVYRLLEQAESATGVRFADPGARQEFADRVNDALGQTLIRQAACQAVVRAGLTLHLRGSGWQDHTVLGAVWSGSIAHGDRIGVYASAKIVLHLDVTGNVAPELLAAAGAGAVVLARSHPSDRGPAGLERLLEPGREIVTFKRHSEMIGHIKQLLADEPARRAIADRARTTVIAKHTMRHRLATLRAAMG